MKKWPTSSAGRGWSATTWCLEYQRHPTNYRHGSTQLLGPDSRSMVRARGLLLLHRCLWNSQHPLWLLHQSQRQWSPSVLGARRHSPSPPKGCCCGIFHQLPFSHFKLYFLFGSISPCAVGSLLAPFIKKFLVVCFLREVTLWACDPQKSQSRRWPSQTWVDGSFLTDLSWLNSSGTHFIFLWASFQCFLREGARSMLLTLLPACANASIFYFNSVTKRCHEVFTECWAACLGVNMPSAV